MSITEERQWERAFQDYSSADMLAEILGRGDRHLVEEAAWWEVAFITVTMTHGVKTNIRVSSIVHYEQGVDFTTITWELLLQDVDDGDFYRVRRRGTVRETAQEVSDKILVAKTGYGRIAQALHLLEEAEHRA